MRVLDLFARLTAGLGFLVSSQAQELQWQSADGHRTAPLGVPAVGRPGFTLLPPADTGIGFTNVLPDSRQMENANLMNGSGVALGDYDGDGLCDIYLCSLEGRNVLYRNRGGWRFEDQTTAAGVTCPGQNSTGAAFADINGDGSLDLLVTALGGPNACFINLGHGDFTNVTAAAGLVSRLGATTMALADVDGNGTLDLYIANYGATSILRSGGALNVTTLPDGRQVVRGRYAQRLRIIDGVMHELGEPDALYLNDGAGRFQPVSWTDGRFRDEDDKPLTAAPWDQGLTALFRDMNGDRFPDLYVCNDASTPERCWINDGSGRFRALPTAALRQTCYFSMGADFGDIDRDGYDDLFVVDMQSRDHRLRLTQKGTMHAQPKLPGDMRSQMQIRRNTLFRARGDGTYAEIANYAGVESSDWTWSCIFIDVDLDGWEDILVSNGFPHNVDDLDARERVAAMGPVGTEASRRTLLLFPPLDTPNVAFHNQRDLTFREAGKQWGFDSRQVSNGMALGDLDNDGDLDVVVNCMNAPALVYRNDSPEPRIAVRLRGRPPNTRGIGARIQVRGGPVTQTQEMICGSRYVSGDDPVRTFAAGTSTNLTIEVTWRSGKRTLLTKARPNHIYELDEPDGPPPATTPPSAPPSPAFFAETSNLLGHSHVDLPFDDFSRQPLLPNRLSQSGPGVAWFDLDNDGWDDLIIAGGKGGQLAVFRNEHGKAFTRLASPHLDSPVTNDQTAVLGWRPTPARAELLVGSANYEHGLTNGPSVLRFALTNGGLSALPGLPGHPGSTGALCLADIDGDGDLDLFVGSQSLVGRYPVPAPSRLFLSHQGELQADSKNSQVLQSLGLVTGACFADLNGDGHPDLVAASYWGPVHLLLNDRGRFRDATTSAGLAEFTGWWNGVAAGDLDGDGRLDIVAGNRGLNDAHRPSKALPARLFFGDLGGLGTMDIIEAYDHPEFGTVPARDLQVISRALPFLRERFPTHAAYASARVIDLLGDRAGRMQELRVTHAASMVFLNRGDHFEARPLPPEAQWAPVFAVAVADFNGDGAEDLFLGQNFCGTPEQAPRLDAGRGLWLRGDGRGGLLPVPGQESGVIAYGEQRGGAIGDYDRDGRVDLVLTQNGAQTRLYRNVAARPGLRVRLNGPPGNPSAVGAQVRLQTGDWKGPVREISSGSGYWSQQSAVIVMGSERPASSVWVRWPGGKTTVSQLPAGAVEVRMDPSGEITERP